MIRKTPFILFLFLNTIAFASIFSDKPIKQKKEKFKAGEMIMHHVTDAYDWHILDWHGHPVSIPLPIIIFHEKKGLKIFMSSKFNHGHDSHLGYKLEHGNIIATDETGQKDVVETSKLWDFSITKNVLSLFFSIVVLLIVFSNITRTYKNKLNTTPIGLRGFLEIMILFVRDDIAKPAIGKKYYKKYLPFLLTDTVGFIRKLPHQLIESFKSTLDEVREADVLLHVIDISHKAFMEQYDIYICFFFK